MKLFPTVFMVYVVLKGLENIHDSKLNFAFVLWTIILNSLQDKIMWLCVFMYHVCTLCIFIQRVKFSHPWWLLDYREYGRGGGKGFNVYFLLLDDKVLLQNRNDTSVCSTLGAYMSSK